MSEAITKACDDCDGTGRDRHDFTRTKCVECDGTGRVPDVEATQRAQLDAQRILIERFDAALRGKESENAELRGEVGRLRAVASDFSAEAQERASELCTERAEVARLTAELDEANFARATMIEGCDSLGNRLTAAKAEIVLLTAEVERLTNERDAWRGSSARWGEDCTRLTAEVERLKGRNDANRPLAIGDVITLDGEVGMVAWVGSERCRVVWSTEAATSEPKDTAIAARSAWLAGCKS